LTAWAARVDGVSKRYVSRVETVVALDQVDFGVRTGELACLYGASGAGKSTLLNVLAGIDLPDSGTVTVTGHQLQQLSDRARADLRLRNVGVVFQSNNLLPELSASDNIALPLQVQGLTRKAARQAAFAALTRLGIGALADRMPAQMSGGQRQRVGIARATAGGKQLLLADEPTGALDTDNSRRLFQLLRQLCDESGTAIVLATHDLTASEVADSVWQMHDGQITRR
jgi:putative ABC transport system ATP-binding protein